MDKKRADVYVGAHVRRRFPSLATGVFEYAIAFETLGLGTEDFRRRMEECMGGHAVRLDWEFLLADAAEHADIRAGFRILPCSGVQFSKDRMRLEGMHFDVGTMVGSQIQKATELAIFVATTGVGLENWAKKAHWQDEQAYRCGAECLCDLALQSTLEWIERRISETAKSARLGTTNRFSPGYCTWPGTDQNKLFSLLPQGFCGVNLGLDGTMDPAHSVSGVIGFGPDAKRLTFQCQTCPVEECYEHINA